MFKHRRELWSLAWQPTPYINMLSDYHVLLTWSKWYTALDTYRFERLLFTKNAINNMLSWWLGWFYVLELRSWNKSIQHSLHVFLIHLTQYHFLCKQSSDSFFPNIENRIYQTAITVVTGLDKKWSWTKTPTSGNTGSIQSPINSLVWLNLKIWIKLSHKLANLHFKTSFIQRFPSSWLLTHTESVQVG